MKLNMWLIVEKLERYAPKYEINNGVSTIEGVRYLSGDGVSNLQDRFVYLCSTNNISEPSGRSNEVKLVNGRDVITLSCSDAGEILNEVLSIFDYYEKWEASLWALSAEKSFQAVLDKAGEALKNPMVLSDMNGNVLALSSDYKMERINQFWVETRETGHIPTTVLGYPFINADGAAVSWKDQPEIYQTPDGTNIIGVYPSRDGEAVAGLSLWEHQTKLSPGHIWLVKVLCNVFLAMSECAETDTPIRSRISILLDLLNGVTIDDVLLQRLDTVCKPPWRLIVINKTYPNQTLALRSVASRMAETGIPCVPMIYKKYVVCLVNHQDAERLLGKVIGAAEKRYYCASISMPFETLSEIAVRLDQTTYAMMREAFRPGLYDATDYALGFIIDSITKANSANLLIHPALNILKAYDKQNDGELYVTLYYYLLYERGILQGAEAVHVHRNSFQYRIKRIKALIDADLENPHVRFYLLISYFLQNGSAL